MAPKEEFVFPERWFDARGQDADAATERDRLETELRREVARGHRLHGEPDVRAIASCFRHCDDALFELSDGRFARVHLSYPNAAPDRPPDPDTEIFSTWEEVERYLTDHEDW